MPDQPRFTHDCSKDQFLGRIAEYDAYYHPDNFKGVYVLRYGNHIFDQTWAYEDVIPLERKGIYSVAHDLKRAMDAPKKCKDCCHEANTSYGNHHALKCVNK